MEFMELVKKRYSSRAYRPDAIEDEKVEAILEAGRLSPTAVNAQPVRVITVRSPEGMAKVSEAANVYGAPMAFIVCSDRDRAWVRNHDGMNSAEIDASIVTTQMMYEATEQGLGSVWICWFRPDLISEAFGLPDNMVPVNILAVGYSDDETSRNHGNRIGMDEFARFA